MIESELKKLSIVDDGSGCSGDCGNKDAISKMPPELLSSILQYLTNVDAARLRHCSKALKEIVESYPKSFWQPEIINLDFFERFVVFEEIIKVEGVRISTDIKVKYDLSVADDCEKFVEMMKKCRPKELHFTLLDTPYMSENVSIDDLVTQGGKSYYSAIQTFSITRDEAVVFEVSFPDHDSSPYHNYVDTVNDEPSVYKFLKKCSLSDVWYGDYVKSLPEVFQEVKASGGIIRELDSVWVIDVERVVNWIRDGPFKRCEDGRPCDISLYVHLVTDTDRDELITWIELNCTDVITDMTFKTDFVYRDGIRFTVYTETDLNLSDHGLDDEVDFPEFDDNDYGDYYDCESD